MKKSKNSEYKIALFSALAGVIFTAIYDLIKDKPILSTLINVFKWIWNKLFEIQIPLWIILLLIILIILFRKFKPKKNNQISDFRKYTKDEFDGILWKWRWERNYNNKWSAQKITPVCDKCGTTTLLNEEYMDVYATCPRCNNILKNLKPTYKIEAIIIDNIDRNLHLNKIQQE